MGQRETFQTDDATKVRRCCMAMYEGHEIETTISGIKLEGRVMGIRRLPDGEFQITLEK